MFEEPMEQITTEFPVGAPPIRRTHIARGRLIVAETVAVAYAPVADFAARSLPGGVAARAADANARLARQTGRAVRIVTSRNNGIGRRREEPRFRDSSAHLARDS